MILTTNRIKSMDDALRSRINLAIPYPELSKTYKQAIFKMFLNQLEPDKLRDYAGIMSWVEEYGCEYQLNGRQIRNAISAALALARSNSTENSTGRVTVNHLQAVAALARQFQENFPSGNEPAWRST
jgi:SpoVK/Ycf46/Vps4 family AAA+-type ATPase